MAIRRENNEEINVEQMDAFAETMAVLNIILRQLLLAMAVIFLAVASVRIAKAETYTCVVHRGEWVWIREAPSYEGRKIGQIRFGYEVEVDNIEQGWAHIRFKGIEGFVDASYIERDIPETMYRVICEGPLAKRETPSGRLLCWIKPGSKISVLGWRYAKDGSLWAKVYKGGYVKASFLGEM